MPPAGISPEIRERILALVAAGQRQLDVAYELGLTPGQVAGICFRARLKAGRVPQPRVKGPKSDPMRKRTEKPLPPWPAQNTGGLPSGGASPPGTPSAVPSPSVLVATMRRETARARTPITPQTITPARTCQWIGGEPSADDACKCGRPTIPGFSYCAPHVARAYQPRRERNEDAAPASIDEWNRRRAERLDAVIGAEA